MRKHAASTFLCILSHVRFIRIIFWSLNTLPSYRRSDNTFLRYSLTYSRYYNYNLDFLSLL